MRLSTIIKNEKNLFAIHKNYKNKHLRLHKKLLLKLVLAFILFTVIGTLSHETGHLLMAKIMGYKHGRINYASTYIGHTSTTDSLDFYYKKYRRQLKHNLTFPERKVIKNLGEKFTHSHSYVLWGGPLQTMLTGTIGLLALTLIRRSKKIPLSKLSSSNWLWVFIALFWLRQVANCFMMFVLLITKGKYGNGDETRLSTYHNLPPWTLNVVTGTLGIIVLYYVIFKFIPQNIRFTFISAGLIGGIAGYILWLHILGPIILP